MIADSLHKKMTTRQMIICCRCWTIHSIECNVEHRFAQLALLQQFSRIVFDDAMTNSTFMKQNPKNKQQTKY